MINFRNVQTNIRNDILSQVVRYICNKYNCKPSEVSAGFNSKGYLRVTINPDCIDDMFECEVTTKVTFNG